MRPEHLDPYLALWTLSTLVGPDALPRARVVVRFDVREVCVHDPGFGDDAVVAAEPAALVAWISGRLSVGQAQRAGSIEVAGPPWTVRMLDGWGRLSPFAAIAPAR